MDAETLRAQLAQFTGGVTFTRHHLLRHMIMTQGVSWLMDQAQSYWLTDIIASYQHLIQVREEHFQVWRLTVDDTTRAAVVTMQDGNQDTPISQQHMSYTDFPLDEITLWLITQGDHLVLMLPSEY